MDLGSHSAVHLFLYLGLELVRACLYPLKKVVSNQSQATVG